MPQDDKYIVLHTYKFIMPYYHKSTGVVVAPLEVSAETVAALQEQLVVPQNVAEAGEGPAPSFGEDLTPFPSGCAEP